MATISFFARITSGTAQASTLVAASPPSTTITFTNDNPNVPGPDTLGDLNLESNGGAADPDTWVIINGITYQFTYNVVGTFPATGKVPVALQGKQVAVITANGINYFFVLDGSGSLTLMDSVGNGNIRLDAPVVLPPPFHVCFCAGTLIATPSGSRPVETLVAGDMLTTADGHTRQIIWVGVSRIGHEELTAHPRLRPVRIPAHAFGSAGPTSDLYVSPQHRVVLDGPQVELMFATDRVLVPARHLVGTFAEETRPDAGVRYFHILMQDHDLIVSNGLASESFQPARRMIDAMAPGVRLTLEETLSALGQDEMLTRPDAVPSLNRDEAAALANAMMAMAGVVTGPASEAAARVSSS